MRDLTEWTNSLLEKSGRKSLEQNHGVKFLDNGDTLVGCDISGCITPRMMLEMSLSKSTSGETPEIREAKMIPGTLRYDIFQGENIRVTEDNVAGFDVIETLDHNYKRIDAIKVDMDKENPLDHAKHLFITMFAGRCYLRSDTGDLLFIKRSECMGDVHLGAIDRYYNFKHEFHIPKELFVATYNRINDFEIYNWFNY